MQTQSSINLANLKEIPPVITPVASNSLASIVNVSSVPSSAQPATVQTQPVVTESQPMVAPTKQSYSACRPMGAVPPGYSPSKSCVTCNYFYYDYCKEYDFPCSHSYVCDSYAPYVDPYRAEGDPTIPTLDLYSQITNEATQKFPSATEEYRKTWVDYQYAVRSKNAV